MMQKEYPQNPKEWRTAIEKGLGLKSTVAKSSYHSGTFPYRDLAQWIESSFSRGYSPEFVPALQRNIKGLVSWAFGDGDEPYWPGSDDD